MQQLDATWFNLLKAYKRRNTLHPDLWFSSLSLALANAGQPPVPFVPIVDGDAEARRARRAADAEAALDRDGDAPGA